MRRLVPVLVIAALLVACADEDASDTVIQGVTSTTTTTGSSTSSTAGATTSTTAFDGATAPTSIASAATEVALLTDVGGLVEGAVDRVTFTFRNALPGADIGYVEPPIRSDGAGEEVPVEGAAFLSVRLEPASGVDLSGDEPQETYTGPDRLRVDHAVIEVVRTGDFEANLTWVLGLRSELPYRVETSGQTLTIVVLGDA